MNATETTTTGSALVGAIETFWAAVADRHPELPRRIVAVTGSGRVSMGMKLGHWAKYAWTTEEGRTPELFISGECISQGARQVANTIIHEAAHALLIARGDETGGTSRQGRYHTKSGFGAAAIELGLELPAEAHSILGFSECSMPDATAALYEAEIAAMAKALTAHIAWVTIEKLHAAALGVGMLLGGGVVLVPWWVKASGLEGIWVGLGGGISKPRAPRVRRPRVVLACGCRSLRLPEAEAADLEDLDCRRCGAPLERQ
jgi:hypothetical protein